MQINEFSAYHTYNPRNTGTPDVLVFAHDHSEFDCREINRAIDECPDVKRIWTEGEPHNPVEVSSFTHITIGWDDPEHCERINAHKDDSRKINEIMIADFIPRQNLLTSKVREFKRGDVVMVGLDHAVFSDNPSLPRGTAESVSRFHQALKKTNLWVVILRCDSKGFYDSSVRPKTFMDKLTELFSTRR